LYETIARKTTTLANIGRICNESTPSNHTHGQKELRGGRGQKDCFLFNAPSCKRIKVIILPSMVWNDRTATTMSSITWSSVVRTVRVVGTNTTCK
jgi:hypothetical protein